MCRVPKTKNNNTFFLGIGNQFTAPGKVFRKTLCERKSFAPESVPPESASRNIFPGANALRETIIRDHCPYGRQRDTNDVQGLGMAVPGARRQIAVNTAPYRPPCGPQRSRESPPFSSHGLTCLCQGDQEDQAAAARGAQSGRLEGFCGMRPGRSAAAPVPSSLVCAGGVSAGPQATCAAAATRPVGDYAIVLASPVAAAPAPRYRAGGLARLQPPPPHPVRIRLVDSKPDVMPLRESYFQFRSDRGRGTPPPPPRRPEGDNSRGAGATRAQCGHCNLTVDAPQTPSPRTSPPPLSALPGAAGECDVLWQASPVSRPADLVLWSSGTALASCIMSRTVHRRPRVSDAVAHCGTCSGCG